MNGPTFLCIGPEKTGTSWLFTLLAQHPDIFLPLTKEIRYFWEKDYLPNDSVWRRLKGDHWHYKSTKNSCIHALRRGNVQGAYWFLKFLFFSHSDAWYLSLFDNSFPIRGDITPIYYRLSLARIEHIAKLLPDIKIIILFRHPVERTWSRAKMVLCTHTGRDIAEVGQKEFYRFFNSDYQELPSYVAIYKNWAQYFPAENIFVGYFDQLANEPLVLLKNILYFLGGKFEHFPENTLLSVTDKINKGISGELPNEYATYLARLFSQCIQEMSQLNCPHTSQWLDKNAYFLKL